MARYLTFVALMIVFAGCQNGLSMFGALGEVGQTAEPINRLASLQEEQQEDEDSPLRNPALATEEAPATFQVQVATTKGDFIIEVTREWSPAGADRFYNMVQSGYFEDIAIFRAIPNFMFQFGIHGDPCLLYTSPSPRD